MKQISQILRFVEYFIHRYLLNYFLCFSVCLKYFIMKISLNILRVAFARKIILYVFQEQKVNGRSQCFQKKLCCSKGKLEKRKVTPE